MNLASIILQSTKKFKNSQLLDWWLSGSEVCPVAIPSMLHPFAIRFIVFNLLFQQFLWVFSMFPLVFLYVSCFRSYVGLLINFSTENNLLILFASTWIETHFALVSSLAYFSETIGKFSCIAIYIIHHRK